jgi:hypothetical protein
MSNVSDVSWDLSPPSQQEIFNTLNVEEVTNDTLPVNLAFTYSFKRPYGSDSQDEEEKSFLINLFELKDIYYVYGK